MTTTKKPWAPPAVGTWFTCDKDRTAWQVKQVDRGDRQLHLYCPAQSRHRFVYANELAKDYSEMPDK